MNIRAETENRFLFKYLIIGIACLGFALWATYDAFIKYPGKMPRAEAWQKLVENESLDDEQRTEQWKSIATENGWKTKRPTKKETISSIQQTIVFNYGLMAVTLAIAIPCIVWFLKNRNSWIEANDQSLQNSFGQQLSLNQITKIDKAKWLKKGIAVVHYQDGQGSQQTFVIDDLKYQRKPTDEIMAWVEQHVDQELIVNGMPEATMQALSEETAEPESAEDQQ